MRLVPLLLLVVPSLARASEPPPAKPKTSQNSQAAAIEAIKKLGGRVVLDKSGRVISVDLGGTKITDAGLLHLKGMTHLRELYLKGTNVTNAGLVHLKGLTCLREMSLRDTKVTDASLVHLKGLTKLRHLALGGTNVTDAGLVHLKGLTHLRGLSLNRAKVTNAGVKKLNAALLKCMILQYPLPPGSNINPPPSPGRDLPISAPKPTVPSSRAQNNRATGPELIARDVLLSPRSGVSRFVQRAEMRQHPGDSAWSPDSRSGWMTLRGYSSAAAGPSNKKISLTNTHVAFTSADEQIR